MLSNHYSAIYSHQYAWVLLILLGVSGALVRHAMVTAKPVQRWTLMPAGLGLLALVYMTAPPSLNLKVNHLVHVNVDVAQLNIRFNTIIQNRCVSCHSATPTDDVFNVAPKGLMLDQPAQIEAAASTIYEQVVVSKIMPLANKTAMTDDERAVVADWARQLLNF